jgi:hypothetical protein
MRGLLKISIFMAHENFVLFCLHSLINAKYFNSIVESTCIHVFVRHETGSPWVKSDDVLFTSDVRRSVEIFDCR